MRYWRYSFWLRSTDCRSALMGGVGLCEYAQHLSIIDHLCVSGTTEARVPEYVDHLHEHFVNPCNVKNAAYAAPTSPGFSIEMKAESLRQFSFGRMVGGARSL